MDEQSKFSGGRMMVKCSLKLAFFFLLLLPFQQAAAVFWNCFKKNDTVIVGFGQRSYLPLYRNQPLHRLLDEPFTTIATGEQGPLNQFTAFAYELDKIGDRQYPTPGDSLRRRGQNPSRLFRGYAHNDNPGGGRRESTVFSIHLTLIADAYGFTTLEQTIGTLVDFSSVNFDIKLRDTFLEGRTPEGQYLPYGKKILFGPGRFGTGGYVETQGAIIVNPYYTFRSYGTIRESVLESWQASGNGYHPEILQHLGITNPHLTRGKDPLMENISADIVLSMVPSYYWDNILTSLSQEIGKPIVLELMVQSSHYRFNDNDYILSDEEQYFKQAFRTWKPYLEKIVSDINAEL